MEGSLGTYSTVHYEMLQGSGRLEGQPHVFERFNGKCYCSAHVKDITCIFFQSNQLASD